MAESDRQNWGYSLSTNSKDKNREYQRKYMSDPIKRRRHLDRQIKYKNRRKAFVSRVKTFVGCQICGFDSHPAALDFHHIDSSQKENLVSVISRNNGTLTKVKLEIRKCIVLCSNCHRIFHAENSKGI